MAKKPEPLLLAAEQEVIKILLVAVILTGIQLGLNILGITGFTNTALMYATATVASNAFTVDRDGFKLVVGVHLPPAAIGIYISVDLTAMLIGVLLWFVVGLINGVNTTINHGEDPDQILTKMSGSNFILKIIYAFISHFALFGFLRFLTNLYELAYSFFLVSKK